jgi:hypothetical protein
VATILTVVGGGFAGSALTYGLTWLRERRRSIDAYRAPQRLAIAEIVAATNELIVCEGTFRQVAGQLIDYYVDSGIDSGEKPSVPELWATVNQLSRSFLGVAKAFQVGQITVVDAQCFEAMGEAFNKFIQIRATADQLGKSGFGVEDVRRLRAALEASTQQLSNDVDDLVGVAREQLSPLQGWHNQRRREQARQRLGAQYFELSKR